MSKRFSTRARFPEPVPRSFTTSLLKIQLFISPQPRGCWNSFWRAPAQHPQRGVQGAGCGGDEDGVLAFGRASMEAYFQALTDKPYVMDKSRDWGVHFDLLQLIFGAEPKIVCLVRDLRQILASMEKKFRQNPDKYRPIESHANLSGTTTLKRAIMGLQSVPVGLALDRLLEVHQRGWAKSILFIRLEDLTSQPGEMMDKVYQYLGVPRFNHNFNEVSQLTEEDDIVFGIPGLHEIRPKVEPLPDDYLEVLGRDAVRHIQTQYAWYFQLHRRGSL